MTGTRRPTGGSLSGRWSTIWFAPWEEGEGPAADLLRPLGGVAETARELGLSALRDRRTRQAGDRGPVVQRAGPKLAGGGPPRPRPFARGGTGEAARLSESPGARISPMTRYTDRDLEAMLADLGSDLVSRKDSLRGGAPTRIGPGGVRLRQRSSRPPASGSRVRRGGPDDGRPTGADIGDGLLHRLAAIGTDGDIVPPPTIEVSRLRIAAREVAVVTVHPSEAPPVRYGGQVWVRTGPRRALASAQDERILKDRRRHRDAPADTRPVRTATLSDLGPAPLGPGAPDAGEPILRERLASAGFIVSAADPTPTVAGVVVLGKRPPDHLPGAYIRFLRIAGTDLAGDIRADERCEGPLTAMLGRLDDKLTEHNRTASDAGMDSSEDRRPPHTLLALRQLIHNAVMHREYESATAPVCPVRVVWFDDRVEITSPGTPFGLVTPETFGQPGAVTAGTRPSPRPCGRLIWPKATGVGLPRARKELRANGQEDPNSISNPPAGCAASSRPARRHDRPHALPSHRRPHSPDGSGLPKTAALPVPLTPSSTMELPRSAARTSSVGQAPMNTTEDKIEGMGDPQEGSWGDYPLDSLLIRNDRRTVYEVLRRIEKGGYIMDPEFQRDFIWTREQQSKLIESVVMRIPLPVFYLAEDQEGRMVVVDGRQRLTTLQRFVNNEFQLNLNNRTDLHGKKFKDLSPNSRSSRRLLSRSLHHGFWCSGAGAFGDF